MSDGFEEVEFAVLDEIRSTGRLASKPEEIERQHIEFLVSRGLVMAHKDGGWRLTPAGPARWQALLDGPADD